MSGLILHKYCKAPKILRYKVGWTKGVPSYNESLVPVDMRVEEGL